MLKRLEIAQEWLSPPDKVSTVLPALRPGAPRPGTPRGTPEVFGPSEGASARWFRLPCWPGPKPASREHSMISGRLTASPRLDDHGDVDDRDLASFDFTRFQNRDLPCRRRRWPLRSRRTDERERWGIATFRKPAGRLSNSRRARLPMPPGAGRGRRRARRADHGVPASRRRGTAASAIVSSASSAAHRGFWPRIFSTPATGLPSRLRSPVSGSRHL